MIKVKQHITFLFSILLLSCGTESSNTSVTGEEELSLNGKWKFHAIYGEGSNYLNIQETENDLLIDNNNKKHVVTKGEWKTKKIGRKGATFFGKNYLQHSFNKFPDKASVGYYPKFKKAGYYEAFVRFPYESHLTAQVTIFHTNGQDKKYFNQRSICDEWLSVGIYRFDESETNRIEIGAIAQGSVSADVVLFRPIPEAEYLKAKKEPNQVYLPEFDDSKWHDLKVPGHWGMINEFSNYRGNAWYRKEIILPSNWKENKNKRVRLKFDGVYHVSNIYLNGNFIGKNRGGFTPFEFDVTDKLNFNGKNIVAVEVDNTVMVGATWNWGGIIRDVTLVKNNDLRISHQYIHADPNLKTGSANIKLRIRVENKSSETKNINIDSKILDKSELATLNGKLTIAANSTKELLLETDLQNVTLWHFDAPKLYQFETNISENGHTLHKATDNFGIRKVTLTDSKMILNGEPVRLAGFNRVSEHRFYGSSEPMSVLEKDVDLMKEAGANFMRIMHGTQNKKLIELCDRKGILIFEEVNVRDLDNEEFTAPEFPLIKKWLKGMIERDINHPSIIGWSVGNELNNHFEFARSTMEYVKTKLDPYRLLTCVSNSGQKPDYTPETDPNTFVDIIMHNMYRWQGEPQEILNTLRKKWPNKPIFISEFGFDPFASPSLDIDKPVLSEWIQHFRNKNEFVVGTSMWTFNDYRSGYGGTSAEENRVWGIINVWRQKRKYFERVKKEQSPVKDIEITNIDFEKNTANIEIPIRDSHDYPSYAMRNYKLEYQFKNTKGKTVYQNSVNLPDLLPKNKIWNGTLKWDTLPEDILALNIKLISPTNYSRFDKTVSFKKAIQPGIKQIIPGKNSVRILFETVQNANEYFVRYKNAAGKFTESYRTITNSIDITNLEEGKEYTFQLFAVNDKGISKGSRGKNASPNKKILPPTIWKSFIADNKLVIGYSSEFEDIKYNVRYGTSNDNLNQKFISNVRGMMSIDLNGENEIYFQIKRKSKLGISSWSQIIKTKH